MIKYLTFVLIFLCTINSIKSQKPSTPPDKDSKKLNVVSKGKNVINLYYGYNIFNSYYSGFTNKTDFKASTLGPMGIVYEHLVTDNIGIGAEFGYQQTTWSYNYPYTSYNGNSLVNYNETYTYKYSLMRIQFRANFHFSQSEKFDAYFLVSAGYRGGGYSATYKSNDPNYIASNSTNNTVSIPTLFVIGVKPGLGMRYFFTDNIGLNLEIALGTPIMCGGLSFKF